MAEQGPKRRLGRAPPPKPPETVEPGQAERVRTAFESLFRPGPASDLAVKYLVGKYIFGIMPATATDQELRAREGARGAIVDLLELAGRKPL